MTRHEEMSDDELLSMSVPFGRKDASLVSLINDWARSVLAFRAVALGPDGYNPENRTPDDFVGALFVRQAIEDGLPLESEEPGRLPILDAADELHVSSTEPDPEGYVVGLASGPADAGLTRAAWWWHRYPARGALSEPARRWYLENGFDPPTVD